MAGAPRRARTEALTEDQILDVLYEMEEGKTLLALCREKDIAYSTIRRKIDESETLRAAYARAKAGFVDAKVEEMHDVAEIEQDVQRARLKSDIVKWHASKVAPRQYGDKLHVEETVNLDDAQVSAKLAALIAKLQ